MDQVQNQFGIKTEVATLQQSMFLAGTTVGVRAFKLLFCNILLI
jgi:hypothetical protein